MSASAMNEMAERSEEFVDYRMVSKAAIFSLTLGFLSLSAFVGVGMLILPLVGIVCGIVGLHSIAKSWLSEKTMSATKFCESSLRRAAFFKRRLSTRAS